MSGTQLLMCGVLAHFSGERMDDSTERLVRATTALIDAALLMAAYGEGTAKIGTGQRSTTRNLAADVVAKSDAARLALRELQAAARLQRSSPPQPPDRP